MRYIKIIFLTLVLVLLAIIVYFALGMWGVALPFSSAVFWKVILTILIADIVAVLLIVAIPFLIKRGDEGYDPKSGKVAQRQKEE